MPYLLDPWIGRTIGDRQRYRLDKRVGAGGMGDVFLAMDTLLGQQVALKLLKDTLVGANGLKRRFEREVAICAALKSDHIVEVSDYGVTTEGHPFYVMEYLRGQSLGQLLRQQQRLSVEQAVNIVTQVCNGLSLAHAGVTLWRNQAKETEFVKVIHRDLKPDNIFLVPTALGELVKILDFGIAKIHNDSENTKLTNTFIGTFHYASPEQFASEKDMDERADIYSLGIILYEMLSGTDPFGFGFNQQEVSAMSWFMAHVSKPPVPLRSQLNCQQMLPELEAIVMRCLQKAPDDRFASVDELKQALQATLAVENVATSTINLQQQIPATVQWQYSQNQTTLSPSEKSPDLTKPAATYNFSPSLPNGEIQATKNKNKRKRLLPKLTAVTTAVVISVSLAVYAHTQSQKQQATTAALKSIKIQNDGKNYQECVNQAKAVPPQSRLYDDAQNLLNQCQFKQAMELATKNNFKAAIVEANKIQLNSSFYQQAQYLINQWSENLLKLAQAQYKRAYNSKNLENAIDLTKAIPKTSSVAKNAETAVEKWQTEWNNNENYLQAAQNALNNRKGSEAITKANQVKLLGQQVKQDTPYWENKIKPIIEKAEAIAASDTPKSKTANAIKLHNAAKPQPRPVPIRRIGLSRPIQPRRAQIIQPQRAQVIQPRHSQARKSGWTTERR